MDRSVARILDAAREKLDEAADYARAGLLSEADRALGAARRILHDGERRLARLRVEPCS